MEVSNELTERELKRLSRRSFLWAGGAVLTSALGLKLFNEKAPLEGEGGVKSVFRSGLNFNDRVAETLFLSPSRLAPEFSARQAVEPRNNYHGVTPEVDLEAWRLNIGTEQLTLEMLKELPEVTQTTELKCVEGWSTIVTWTGCRFIDFAKRYNMPPTARYVSFLSEPSGYEEAYYYVGIDIASCLHPQTLLAWGMNGSPLTTEHGAPLRLVLPHKYGIKNIKLITSLSFETEPPKDYWAERGYDYFAGL